MFASSFRIGLLAGRCLSVVVCAARALAGSAVAADDPVQMTIDLVRRDDVEGRAIGLDQVRYGIKGEATTRRLAELLPSLPPARQVELIAALGARGDVAALPAITALLSSSQDAAVRSAALHALGRLGAAPEVAVLTGSLRAADPEKAAARRALVDIRGDAAATAILAASRSGDQALRPQLFEILAERRVVAAIPDLLTAATTDDPQIRGAAMQALGRLGGPEQVAGMVQGVLKAAAGGERDAAERAIVTVCTQNRGSKDSADLFVERFKAAGDADRELLLPALGRIGGPAALAIVDALVADADPVKRSFGLKALTRWPDATVSSRLLTLLGKSQDPAERAMLLSTLIRIAPLPDNKLNDKQKLELLQKTMQLCEKDEDRARILERANAIRTIETFRFVASYLDEPKLAEPACKSVVELAHHQKLRDANKAEFVKTLDKVITTTKNAELVERANRYKEGKTWERKKG